MPPLKYLSGYSPDVLARVQALIDAGRLNSHLRERYPEPHTVRNEAALIDYVQSIKSRYLRSAPPVAKIAWDPRMQQLQQTLGTHTAISRVQGGRLKAKREIRIASLFKDAPAPFLKMIVVHELAHLKERAHDKAFYSLCTHMEPEYYQLEFDTRLWLTAAKDGRGLDPSLPSP
ncbi:MAG: YgjP-like metallopeptidase domain-containing protein [Burkholderiaceae bacterium]